MYRAHVLTISDSSYYENKKDLSGEGLVKYLKELGYEVVGYDILSDDKELISNKLKEICDKELSDLILTTGGTGFNKRDNTPEATMDVIEKFVPGFGELMRLKSYEITKAGILSRSVSGIRKSTLIINLPGSPKASYENLSFIADSLNHALKMLLNDKNDCANMKDER